MATFEEQYRKYSTSGQGQAIKSVKSLSPGDTITVELSDGKADCLVQSVTEKP